MDTYAPTPAAMLAGHNGSFADAYDLPPETNQPAATWRTDRLSAAAQCWVNSSAPTQPTPAALPGTLTGEPDAFGVRDTQQLRTQPVASSFFPAAAQGVVLLEPFGGLCAGLEMLLRNGTAVKQYYYLDSNATSRKVAAHRIQQLAAQYPLLLPASAVIDAFSLP
jgi:hypothetical protein